MEKTSKMTFVANKVKTLMRSIEGECLKAQAKLCNFAGCKTLGSKYEGKDVIISVTSYGRRINKALPFCLYSIFKQTIMPSKVVLVLDDYEKDLPGKDVEFFVNKGLTIIYDSRDLRSYKKLIPTMEHYPEDIIITVDDDIYYNKDMVSNLLKSYAKDKNAIHANRVHHITFDNLGNANGYSKWISGNYTDRVESKYIFPTGCGGIMYQKRLLHEDVLNYKLAKQLCPLADDIWFYVMAKLAGSRHVKVGNNNGYGINIDNFYQATHQGSRLEDSNVAENMNESQFQKVLAFYKTNMEELLHLEGRVNTE